MLLHFVGTESVGYDEDGGILMRKEFHAEIIRRKKDPGRREKSVMHRAIRDEVRRQQEPDPERTWSSCSGSQIFSYRKWRPLSSELHFRKSVWLQWGRKVGN